MAALSFLRAGVITGEAGRSFVMRGAKFKILLFPSDDYYFLFSKWPVHSPVTGFELDNAKYSDQLHPPSSDIRHLNEQTTLITVNKIVGVLHETHRVRESKEESFSFLLLCYWKRSVNKWNEILNFTLRAAHGRILFISSLLTVILFTFFIISRWEESYNCISRCVGWTDRVT